MTHPSLEPLLSPEGWVHASTDPVDRRGPRRFHALFGRDSLITALQVLPERPEIAAATLRALASRQGRDRGSRDRGAARADPARGPAGGPRLAGRARLAGARRRDALLRHLGRHLLVPRRARRHPGRRRWPMSWQPPACRGRVARARPGRGGRAGAVRTATLPRRPAPAGLARRARPGDRRARRRHRARGRLHADRRRWPTPTPRPRGGGARRTHPARPRRAPTTGRARASALRSRIEESFVPDVMALEADDRPVPGAGSQLGWLLWADALSPAAASAGGRAADPARRAHGVRRADTGQQPSGFLTEGYHRGAIWPFDSWLCWGGLRAAGYDEAAEQVRRGRTPGRDDPGPLPRALRRHPGRASCGTSRSPTGSRPGPSAR